MFYGRCHSYSTAMVEGSLLLPDLRGTPSLFSRTAVTCQAALLGDVQLIGNTYLHSPLIACHDISAGPAGTSYMYMLTMLILPTNVVLMQPASIYWQRTVVKKRWDPKKKAMVVFEEMPGCPGWSWPADESLRQIACGDQGIVY